MTQTITQKMEALRCCVIIPTYNNEKTLTRLIDGVKGITSHIIIVNDGATDGTSEILKNYPTLTQIHLPENQGKGNALREGFKKAVEMEYEYAITIDSDGQHFPEDISVFIDTLEIPATPSARSEDKNLLLIGARNMTQEGVPKKSSFGNKFSNFWFWFETGITLTDTQSGYRMYPLNAIKDIKFFTKKFEFEIEVIVKAAWRGVKVQNVPVQVLYDESERVSHFRPLKDFTRISILNTWLVLVTMFYIKPRDFIRNFKKKSFKKFVAEDLFGVHDSPLKKAKSVALGVFIGISPIWGLHTITVIFLAVALKLNKVIAFVFSNVSLPPFIPFVVLASLQVGNWMTGSNFTFTYDLIDENFELMNYLKTYIIGSFTLASVAATVFGVLSFLVFSLVDRKKVKAV